MFTIAKTFTFSMGHRLYRLPAGHPCRNLHGHNYTVEIILEAPGLDGRSFVKDYRDLAAFRAFLEKELDHRHLVGIAGTTFVVVDTPEALLEAESLLGDSPDLRPPTAENMAQALAGVARDLYPGFRPAVRVSETGTTWAEYRD